MLTRKLIIVTALSGLLTLSGTSALAADHDKTGHHHQTTAAQVAEKIDINKADVDQLAALKGIGPSKAKAIVDFRVAHGPFKTVQGLTQVHGVGPGLLKRIEGQIEVN